MNSSKYKDKRDQGYFYTWNNYTIKTGMLKPTGIKTVHIQWQKLNSSLITP